MLITFQDYQSARDQLAFIRDAIWQHQQSDAYKLARIADEYDRQRNVTIYNVIERIYNALETSVPDDASRNRIASNFFHRLNKARCTYSLGNGVSFVSADGDVKQRLGLQFDTVLYSIAYDALIHGVCFGFWSGEQLHKFSLTEFVPLWDEYDGSLRAGIRFWSLDWRRKPVTAVLYEEDGYTTFTTKDGKTGLDLALSEPKRPYKLQIRHTEVRGDEVIGGENYSALPIFPLWGSRARQSTLVGLRSAIDSYDLIRSGFANDVQDCAKIYWIVENCGGMDAKDMQAFLDNIRYRHIATADTKSMGVEGASLRPYTQDVPYQATTAYLEGIREQMYEDFCVFDPEKVQAGNVTATQIMAGYQPMDEEADDFEYQIIEFLRKLLALQGIEAMPTFKRNRITNQTEEINAVLAEAKYLDDETVLDKLPNITPDEKTKILLSRKG